MFTSKRGSKQNVHREKGKRMDGKQTKKIKRKLFSKEIRKCCQEVQKSKQTSPKTFTYYKDKEDKFIEDKQRILIQFQELLSEISNQQTNNPQNGKS